MTSSVTAPVGGVTEKDLFQRVKAPTFCSLTLPLVPTIVPPTGSEVFGSTNSVVSWVVPLEVVDRGDGHDRDAVDRAGGPDGGLGGIWIEA